MDQNPNLVEVKGLNRGTKAIVSLKYELCSPVPPRNPASLGCCAVCVCHVLYGGISYLAWLNDIPKCHCSNLYSIPSVMGETNQALRNGWACAPCWALPPWKHILELLSLPSLLEDGIAALSQGFLSVKHYKWMSPHQPFLRIHWRGS